MTPREMAVEMVARAICGAENLVDPNGIGDHGGNEPNWKFHMQEAAAVVQTLLFAGWREPPVTSPLKFPEL